MKRTFLDFERPIAELEAKIDELRRVEADPGLDIEEEIARLQPREPIGFAIPQAMRQPPGPSRHTLRPLSYSKRGAASL